MERIGVVVGVERDRKIITLIKDIELGKKELGELCKHRVFVLVKTSRKIL